MPWSGFYTIRARRVRRFDAAAAEERAMLVAGTKGFSFASGEHVLGDEKRVDGIAIDHDTVTLERTDDRIANCIRNVASERARLDPADFSDLLRRGAIPRRRGVAPGAERRREIA
jgi:hypothetical protein